MSCLKIIWHRRQIYVREVMWIRRSDDKGSKVKKKYLLILFKRVKNSKINWKVNKLMVFQSSLANLYKELLNCLKHLFNTYCVSAPSQYGGFVMSKETTALYPRYVCDYLSLQTSHFQF